MAYKLPPTAMKKTTIVMLFVAVLGLSITSCSKDDDVPEPNVVLSTTNIVMYYEQTKKLTAENATSWRTENDFVATVDKDGLVTGGHVGTTKIIASNGSSSATCNVTIQPKYNLYDSPILDWGASMSEIRNKETHENMTTASTSTSLAYLYNNSTDNPVIALYSFENGKLDLASVILKWNTFSSAVNHLLERYQVVAVDYEKQVALFWDAYTREKLKTAVTISLTELSGTPVIQILFGDAAKIESAYESSKIKYKVQDNQSVNVLEITNYIKKCTPRALAAPMLLPFKAK